MKSAKIVEEKLKKVVDVLFVKELLGMNIYDNLSSYPQLIPLVDILREEAYKMECLALNADKDYYAQLEVVKDVTESIKVLCKEIPDYKESKLFENLL